MSGIGHFAAGLAAKPVANKAPLWVLLAASEANDLLYFVFTRAGVEKSVPYTMDFTQGVRYLASGSHPWSHGLFMSVVWSVAAAVIAYLLARDRRTAGVIGLVVFSHWGLDFLMHANLPLFFGGSPLIGLGLENSGPGFLLMTALDLILLAAGMAIYLRHRKRTSAPQPAGKLTPFEGE